VLATLLFVIYINNLEENLGSMISKFADDNNIGGRVRSEEAYRGLQRDLDQLGQWADEWQMEFILHKCEVMDFGRSNQDRTCSVHGRTLVRVIEKKRSLGTIHSSFNVQSQVDRMVEKAFSMLGFIGQNIEYKSWDVLLKLYKTLVRPHLEYCVQFWPPYYRKERVNLEGVQKRFSRMLPELDILSYKERMDRLGLFSLERRRLRGDLIEVNKIMRGIDQLDSQYLFPKVGESKTRGHSFKMRGERISRFYCICRSSAA